MERYTFKTKNGKYLRKIKPHDKAFYEMQKLGQVEDLMEKYDIKDLQHLENIIIDNGTNDAQAKDYYKNYVKPLEDNNEKIEKVWKLIKDKGVNIADVRESILSCDMSYGHYAYYQESYSWDLLTEEEYNFLKEEILKDERRIKSIRKY